MRWSPRVARPDDSADDVMTGFANGNAGRSRIKLLQVMASRQHGGAEIFFSRLCTALASAGIQQQVVLRSGTPYLGDFAAAGIPTVEMPFLFSYDVVTRRRLRRLIDKFAPEVVLTWMSRATTLCPKGQFVHVGRLGGYYDLKYYGACDYLVGNTKDIADWAVRGGWAAERVRYLPNFVDEVPAAPLPRASFDTPPDAQILLALGRLHSDKAFDVLLRAMTKLPTAHLWLAGEGPLDGELRALAQSLGVAGRTHFLGWRSDVGAMLKTADCLVCPSRVEPLGNVILEAWMQRTPVVAADSLGPRGLVENETTGLLVRMEDADGLAAAIGRVLGDKALASRLSQAAYETYHARFNRESVVARYVEFLTEVAA